MPRVSFIIPVYNGRRFLDGLFETLDAQTFSDWEAVVVDDSSSDGSWEVLQRKAREDGRYRVFRKENGRYANRGVAYAVSRMRGGWFMYMSQDDILSSDLLERMLESADEGVDAIVPRMETWDSSGSRPFVPACSPGESVTGREAFLLSINWKIHGFTLFRSSLTELFAPDTESINSDEYDTRRYYFYCRRVVFSEGTFMYHTGNPQAVTVKWDIDRTGFVDSSRKLWDFARDNGVLADAAPEIRRLTADLGISLLGDYSRALGRGDASRRDAAAIFGCLRRVTYMYRGIPPGRYLAARFFFRALPGYGITLRLFGLYRRLRR